MAKRSKFQQQLIKNYYANREALALQRLQELTTELYLSEGKKRQRLWQSIAGHLEKLGVARAHIDHLMKQNKPELVAKLITKLIDQK